MNYFLLCVVFISCLYLGFAVGKTYGEKVVKRVFLETINDLEMEIDEDKLWKTRGEKVNETPVPRFGLIQFYGNYDRLFGLKQSMGKRIKSLFTKVGK